MDCRRISCELESAQAAARDFEERLKFQLESSMNAEEENEARVKEMNARILSTGRKLLELITFA
jgi:hypothetical protein